MCLFAHASVCISTSADRCSSLQPHFHWPVSRSPLYKPHKEVQETILSGVLELIFFSARLQSVLLCSRQTAFALRTGTLLFLGLSLCPPPSLSTPLGRNVQGEGQHREERRERPARHRRTPTTPKESIETTTKYTLIHTEREKAV